MKPKICALTRFAIVSLSVIALTVPATPGIAGAASDISPLPSITESARKSLSDNGAAIAFAIEADDAVSLDSTFGEPFPIAFLNLNNTESGFLSDDEIVVFNYGVVAYNAGTPERVITSDLEGNASGSFFLVGLEAYSKVKAHEVVLLGGALDDRYILSEDSTHLRPLNEEGQEVFNWGGAKGELSVSEFRAVKSAYDAEVQANYEKLIHEQFGDEVPEGGVVGGLSGLAAPAPIASKGASYKMVLGAALFLASITGLIVTRHPNGQKRLKATIA
jgi:hypothetical protein